MIAPSPTISMKNICTDPNCICRLEEQQHISLGAKRLCCLTNPVHKCPNCTYRVCKECTSLLQIHNSLEGRKKGKNTMWDDHNRFSPECPQEEIQPI